MTSDKPPRLVVISADQIPDLPDCCAHARERGYRAGYRDGYMYALWDVDRMKALGARLWDEIERFTTKHLRPWVWRASHCDGPVPWEGGPRLRVVKKKHCGKESHEYL